MAKDTLKIDAMKAWRSTLKYVAPKKKTDDDEVITKPKEKSTWANRP